MTPVLRIYEAEQGNWERKATGEQGKPTNRGEHTPARRQVSREKWHKAKDQHHLFNLRSDRWGFVVMRVKEHSHLPGHFSGQIMGRYIKMLSFEIIFSCRNGVERILRWKRQVE